MLFRSPADRRREQISVLDWRTHANFTVGGKQLDDLDMIAEGTVTVMIFTMHIRRDSPAECDIPGAGSGRHEEAARQQMRHQLRQRNPRLGVQQAGVWIEIEHAIEVGEPGDGLPLVQSRVAV